MADIISEKEEEVDKFLDFSSLSFKILITFVLQVTESLEESKAERGPGGEVTQQEQY